MALEPPQRSALRWWSWLQWWPLPCGVLHPNEQGQDSFRIILIRDATWLSFFPFSKEMLNQAYIPRGSTMPDFVSHLKGLLVALATSSIHNQALSCWTFLHPALFYPNSCTTCICHSSQLYGYGDDCQEHVWDPRLLSRKPSASRSMPRRIAQQLLVWQDIQVNLCIWIILERLMMRDPSSPCPGTNVSTGICFAQRLWTPESPWCRSSHQSFEHPHRRSYS